ncbi:hypothetical protein TNCV_2492891 [Trichonephila clavipes]|uniref:Uncharacterized protein n=1 Tax=Trichonephila clavipes TaxID=2585209 RepID=A0A8X6V985_TRICX|nr:hypothetical protein TNCV_2492891 [Trichonephila clavipes]
MLSANGNQDSQPTETFFQPTSDTSETAPCHILLTNQRKANFEPRSSEDNKTRAGIQLSIFPQYALMRTDP